MRPIIYSVTVSILLCLFASRLPKLIALDMLGLLLVAIAALNVGLVLQTGSYRNILIETLAGLGFGFLALWGMWRHVEVLAAGYFVHGLWTVFHHPRGGRIRVPRWYPPTCLAFDWVIVLFILYWWR